MNMNKLLLALLVVVMIPSHTRSTYKTIEHDREMIENIPTPPHPRF
jgi:hypothetical protein